MYGCSLGCTNAGDGCVIFFSGESKDRWPYGQTDGMLYRRMVGRKNVWIEGRSDAGMDGRSKDRRSNRGVVSWKDGWMDGQIESEIEEWSDGAMVG